MRRSAVFIVLLLLALLRWPLGAEASVVEVIIDSSVRPAVVYVEPGSVLTWRNLDGERHRVRSIDGPEEFDSGNLEPGAAFSVVLDAVGTYRYVDDRDRDDQAYWGTVAVGTASPGGDTGSPSPSPPPGDGTGMAPAPASASVSIINRTFDPPTIRVAIGGTVSWANQDDRLHTVTARDGSFDSGMLSPGQGFQQPFPAAGTFPYFCNLHPEMQGTVEAVAADGSVPPPVPGTPAGAGTSGSAPGPTARGEAPGSPGGETPALSSTAAVTIVDFGFTPDAVTVTTGGTVTWTNAGIAPHTVSATDDGLDSGILESRSTYSFDFPASGTFTYRCDIHPQMVGTVRVVDPGGEALAGDGPSTADSAGLHDGSAVQRAVGRTSGDHVAGQGVSGQVPGRSPAVAPVLVLALVGTLAAAAFAHRTRLLALIRR